MTELDDLKKAVRDTLSPIVNRIPMWVVWTCCIVSVVYVVASCVLTVIRP